MVWQSGAVVENAIHFSFTGKNKSVQRIFEGRPRPCVGGDGQRGRLDDSGDWLVMRGP